MQLLIHKVKQGTVFVVDSWNMIDQNKKGRPPDDLQSPGGGEGGRARSLYATPPSPPPRVLKDFLSKCLFFLVFSLPCLPGKLGLFAKHSPTSLSVLTAE